MSQAAILHITSKQESRNGVADTHHDEYQYDYAGRLSREESVNAVSTTGIAFSYDPRGNVQQAQEIGSGLLRTWSYLYSGDMLSSETISTRRPIQTNVFAHDNLGRMTSDGHSGTRMEYSHMDLLTKVASGDSILVNYSKPLRLRQMPFCCKTPLPSICTTVPSVAHCWLRYHWKVCTSSRTHRFKGSDGVFRQRCFATAVHSQMSSHPRSVRDGTVSATCHLNTFKCHPHVHGVPKVAGKEQKVASGDSILVSCRGRICEKSLRCRRLFS